MSGVMRSRPLVLDVNDDVTLHEVFRAALEREGYDVITADDGREGIEVALLEKPDLILMNYMMPLMDGDRATRILREYPQMRDVPIILNTACDGAQTLERLMTSGFTNYFTLPISHRKIIEMVKRYCPVPE
jgi:two-component system alkaline phosphatase synthesis response regulator PhoP